MCGVESVMLRRDWVMVVNIRKLSWMMVVANNVEFTIRMTEGLIDDKQTYTDQKCDVRIKFSL